MSFHSVLSHLLSNDSTHIAADPLRPENPIEKAKTEAGEKKKSNDGIEAPKDADKFICATRPKWTPKKDGKGFFWKTVVKYKSKSGPDGAMVVNLGEDKKNEPKKVVIKSKRLSFC